MTRRLAALAAACAIALLAPAPARADAEAEADQDLSRLANMSLEELMNTKVSAVAGHLVSRFATPAAVTVLSAEDLRRSGARNVPDALRLVPGMFVGQVNAGSWVIGGRGLTASALTATRYLVLVDGRLVYDPLLSTTNWDVVDVPLADVDRIEVIGGPGATLWGVNAMNGVVNIITRPAAATLGTRVEAGAGSHGEQGLSWRYGAPRGDDGAFRVWAKYDHHGAFENAAGDSIEDQWSSLHGGFRLDGRVGAETTYTLQGDAYTHPQAHERVQLPIPGEDRAFEIVRRDDTVDGANLLFRLLDGLEGERGWMLRAYVDHTRRDTSRFGVRRDTADVEYRHWLPWGERNQLIWGVQADHTRDDVDNGPVLQFSPSARGWTTLNAFVQNTTELVDDRLFVMVGSKFTRHAFVPPQVQPSVRLWWTPGARQTLWAAVSRPVRVPSRFEEDGLLVFAYVDRGLVTTGTPDGVIVPLGLGGDERLRPEQLLAWEAGYRVQPSDRLAVDANVFYNDYRRLIGVPPGIYGRFTDAASGATWGGNLSVTARVTDGWRLEGSYSRLRTRIDGPVFPFDELSTPREMAQLHSYLDLGARWELDAALYHVGRIPFFGTAPYNRADLGITWRPRDTVEVSLWGKNLFDAAHRELSGALVPRTVYAQVAIGLDR